jgi:hypothetical protein
LLYKSGRITNDGVLAKNSCISLSGVLIREGQTEKVFKERICNGTGGISRRRVRRTEHSEEKHIES